MKITKLTFLLLFLFTIIIPLQAQKNKKPTPTTFNPDQYSALNFRNIGPHRGGRSNTVCGIANDPMTYYMGTTGGGIWKTEDAGVSWRNISDGFFKTGSVGAVAVAPSDPNVIYVGMGEHAVRGVMTSHGDGVYKSTDAGKTWKHLGLPQSRHIARIRVHPTDAEVVYVAVQGAVHGASKERGIYKSTDGGATWDKVHFVDENTGASDLSMDASNPNVLYAATWEHRRYPWLVESGGAGSGLWKSTDGGANWERLTKGLPEKMGKTAIDVSRANPDRVFANIEAEGDKGGVYRSDDGGKTWKQTSKDRITIARAWYYTEIYADPVDKETVYVMNAPFLKSIDGGKTFQPVVVPHGDQHDIWINPTNNKIMINANDGGSNISFNGGKTWSTQQNQPTAQFYRVIADRRFPYHLYAGQQDNSTLAIASRTKGGRGIGWKDWYRVAGGESAFLAFDPDNPRYVYGGSYQGNISEYDHETKTTKDIMSYPFIGLSWQPKDMQYRFNWNAPIVAAPGNPSKIYHAGNVVFKTENRGQSWSVISPDLTRNEKDKQGPGGAPFTNEAAGGENYNTISYLAASPHQDGVLWVGTDDGLVHLTKDDGANWTNVTPPAIGEALINAIEVSPYNPAAAYIAVTKYKFNDFTPFVYFTHDLGETWTKITHGIANEDFVRVVREDPVQKGLLYAGTETGLYISFNNGQQWHRFQLNLPVCPITDLTIADNDLVVATSGRAFWILDDLSAIRQSMGSFGNQTVAIYQPKATVRFDAPTPPKLVPNWGQNPLNGVIVDYYLQKEIPDSMTLTLEVLNGKGNVLRTYTNQKDKKHKPFPGGPPPKAVLPAKAGLNRFNWDMRRTSIDGIDKVFVFGGYKGSLVAPNKYELRLSTATDTVRTICSIIPDPRLDTPAADYAAQQTVFQKIEHALVDIHQSVNEMRMVKKQVQFYMDLLEGKTEHESLLKQAKDIKKQITDWENHLIQPDQQTFQDVINFKNKLSSEFFNLMSRADTHDPKPTDGVQMRLKDLLTEWGERKAALQKITGELMPAFNEGFLRSGVRVLGK